MSDQWGRPQRNEGWPVGLDRRSGSPVGRPVARRSRNTGSHANAGAAQCGRRPAGDREPPLPMAQRTPGDGPGRVCPSDKQSGLGRRPEDRGEAGPHGTGFFYGHEAGPSAGQQGLPTQNAARTPFARPIRPGAIPSSRLPSGTPPKDHQRRLFRRQAERRSSGPQARTDRKAPETQSGPRGVDPREGRHGIRPLHPKAPTDAGRPRAIIPRRGAPYWGAGQARHPGGHLPQGCPRRKTQDVRAEGTIRPRRSARPSPSRADP